MTALPVDLLPISWCGDSRDVLQKLPKAARVLAGNELFRLQVGLEPKHWRQMKTIGPGVREIRISTRGEFRIVYVTEAPAGPVVLHTFAKNTRKTRPKDIEVARQRLGELRRQR